MITFDISTQLISPWQIIKILAPLVALPQRRWKMTSTVLRVHKNQADSLPEHANKLTEM